MIAHPATLSGLTSELISQVLFRHHVPFEEGVIVDPFAGVGSIHELRGPWDTWGIELEPEWALEPIWSGWRQTDHNVWVTADQGSWVVVGSCLDRGNWPLELPVNAIVTSPCYGNRMADHHQPKEGSKRNTYRHTLGRPLTEGSAAAMQWGKEYQEFHEKAWCLAVDQLEPGGLFVLNISDHIRKGVRVPVEAWHLHLLSNLGLHLVEAQRIATKRQRFGRNGNVRVDGELLAVLKKGF